MKFFLKVMFVLGVFLLLITGYLAYSTYQFQTEAVHADGEITDLRYSRNSESSSAVWFPTVTFVDATGKKHVFESSVGSSGYRNTLGDKVDVIYRQDDAENARINKNTGLYFSSVMCGIFAVVFIIIAGAGLLLMGKGNRHRKLIHEGKPVKATIVKVELNTAIEFNGRSPWRIVCQWLEPQSGKVFLFNSANINYDPSPYLDSEYITVYVATNNPKKYYVDTSHLPQKA